MQHWVLCEILDELSRRDLNHLLLACTHSMAPWSVMEPVDYDNPRSTKLHRRRRFDHVRSRLGVRPMSHYERAWGALSSQQGLPYPSSAVFASYLWPAKLSLLLCEYESSVADEIRSWLSLPEVKDGLAQKALHEGDWRTGLVQEAIARFEYDVLVIELDPMQFEHHSPEECSRNNTANLYPEDLELIVRALASSNVPVVVQVSSYDVNNNNPHPVTEPMITQLLAAGGFQLAARVKGDDLMFSHVYCRNVSLWQSSDALNRRYVNWLPMV